MAKTQKLFNSLQFQLIFWSVLSLLLLAIIAGGYGFWYSYNEINDFQDDNLESTSALLEQFFESNGSSDGKILLDNKGNPRVNVHFDTDDDDGSITVDVINTTIVSTSSDRSSYIDDHDNTEHDDNITLKDLPTIPKGISTQTIDDDVWRVYRNRGIDTVIVVRQRTEFQDDLAKSSALQSFLPLIIGMTLLMLLLPFITWRMLKPVRQLQKEISQRRESDLDPLLVDKLPTELLPLAESLNRLLVLVKTSIERQQRFVADAAHELRSPLTAISLQLQRLQRHAHDSTMSDGLNKLAIRLSRNQKLVEQLLALARADSILNHAEHKPVSIKMVVEKAIGLVIPIADSKNIALAVELQTNDCVRMDETSALILIKNLIQNAIIYTPLNGHVAVKLFYLKQSFKDAQALTMDTYSSFGTHVIRSTKINKSTKGISERLVIQVMDSGKGIRPDDYATVFEPFVRVGQTSVSEPSNKATRRLRSDNASKQTEQIEGTGLGLSIVKSICEQADIDVFMNTSLLTASELNGNQGLCITLIF